MSLDQNPVHGFPYVPGGVCGTLCRGVRANCDDEIVMISHHELESIRPGWAGIIVVDGAPFSHAMIRILSFGVPTLIVSSADAARLKEGRRVRLDADTGVIRTGVQGAGEGSRPEAPRPPEPGQSIVTHDGVNVSLRASVRDVSGVQAALRYGAESIGLVRSEFLMPADGKRPDAEFYRAVFREIGDAARPLTVTLRLLDLAVDKQPEWLPRIAALNTPLGMQGARLFHLEPVKSVFYAQLQALDLLGGQQGAFRLLIPYLVRREELRYWVDELRSHLSHEMAIGAMVETPAGALDLANWFDLVDFVAIGCNDLMQCLFAADRDQPELRHYLDPYAPLLYRFMRQVAESTESYLDRIQLCGILPQLQGVLPLLLGLGFRAFSVEPRLIPYLARSVESTNVKDARRWVGDVCRAKETREVRKCLGVSPYAAASVFT